VGTSCDTATQCVYPFSQRRGAGVGTEDCLSHSGGLSRTSFGVCVGTHKRVSRLSFFSCRRGRGVDTEYCLRQLFLVSCSDALSDLEEICWISSV
jgi:hypothetical protein